MTDKFVPVPHEFLDLIISPATDHYEKSILAFMAKKIYGFHKKTDQISLSQFENKCGFGRKYVNLALKRLVLVSLLKLVKKGNSRLACNEWMFDLTDHQEKLVSLMKLVSSHAKTTSFMGVPKKSHTKDSITKDRETTKNNPIGKKELSLGEIEKRGYLTPEDGGWVE